MTYYRIHPAEMTQADCHESHVSRLWIAAGDEDEAREGLSVCRSYEALVGYFTGQRGEHSPGRGAILEGAHLVLLEGRETDADPWESCYGEALIHPTRVVQSVPVADAFLGDLVAAVQSDWCDIDERASYAADRDEIVIERRCGTCEGAGIADNEECWECRGIGWVS